MYIDPNMITLFFVRRLIGQIPLAITILFIEPQQKKGFPYRQKFVCQEQGGLWKTTKEDIFNDIKKLQFDFFFDRV